jgi:hypothetical protein
MYMEAIDEPYLDRDVALAAHVVELLSYTKARG